MTVIRCFNFHLFLTLIIVGLMLSPLLTAASSGERWVATRTGAQEVPDAIHIGELSPDEPAQLVVSLHLRNKPALDTLTSQTLTSTSARRMSSDEFMLYHAPTEQQATAVADYLKKHHFLNIQVAKNRLLVSADGTAGMIKKAFKTGLHFYRKNGKIIRANIDPASVPERLAGTVSAIIGLQTFVKDKTTYRKATHGTATRASSDTTLRIPQATLYGTAMAEVIKQHHLTEFPAIYNAHNLPPALNTTAGIITEGDMTQTLADLTQFAAISGFPVPEVRVISVGDQSTDVSDDVVEWNMDTQAVLTAAGGTVKQLLLYNVNSLTHANVARAFNQAVADNLAQVISVSLGSCEIAAASSGYDTAINTILQAGIAQGQTFVLSTGDTGSYECNKDAEGQSFPASSPYVIAVGGTSLFTTVNNSWMRETAWDFAGGGPSISQLAPDWQIRSGAIPGNATARGIPDIALSADPDSGGLILVNGNYQLTGGTSLAAPLFAGFWARIQSAYGNQLPFPASLLYMGAKNNPDWFRDVASGNNGIFRADAGWDYATGFGSLNIGKFAAAFRNESAFRPKAVFIADQTPVHGISLAKGSTVTYCFNVPDDPMSLFSSYYLHPIKNSASLVFRLYGGTGNGDLFSQHTRGSPLTNINRLSGPDNNENFTFYSVHTGHYCIDIKAIETVSNASLIADYKPGKPTGVLQRGDQGVWLNMPENSGVLYTIRVPEDKFALTFTLRGTGDGDLYVKWGSAPSVLFNDATSHQLTSSNETITISIPKPGIYYVLVDAVTEVKGTLSVNYSDTFRLFMFDD